MKFSVLLALLFALTAALELRGAPAADDALAEQIRVAVQHARARGPVGAAISDDVLTNQILTAVYNAHAEKIRTGKGPVGAASTDEILAEVKFQVEVCGKSAGPLSGLTLDELFAELKKRRDALKCAEKAAAAAAAAAAGAGGDAAAAAGDATAKAEEAAATTTTTTPMCPDNFMDEIVDQANPDFDLFDANRDGCLEEGELTTTLRKQIEIAHHRDYYWIRRNITDAARELVKKGKKTHAAADENDSGCLNKDELDVIHHAICDCATQFMFMDHNADGKISQQEAATFVSAHMPQADLNYITLHKVFKVADVDANKYLSEKEFCEAGPKYKGDGPQYSTLPGPTPQVATGKHWLPPAPVPAPAPAL